MKGHAARIAAAIGRLGMELEEAGFEPGDFAIAFRSPGAIDRLRWISKGELVRDHHAPHGKAATWRATVAGVEVHELGTSDPLASAGELAIARLIFGELEKQGPTAPYVGTGDDLERVTLDGDFDLLELARVIIQKGRDGQ